MLTRNAVLSSNTTCAHSDIYFQAWRSTRLIFKQAWPENTESIADRNWRRSEGYVERFVRARASETPTRLNMPVGRFPNLQSDCRLFTQRFSRFNTADRY